MLKPAHSISVKRRIAAAPERLYALIADYHVGHPSILPRQFSNLVVEKGGVGAGTLIRFDMRLLGRTRTCRASITEPRPGRVLVERDLDGRTVTTFRVDPGPTGHESDVTIETQFTAWRGPFGILQGALLKRLITPLYEKELLKLRARATGATKRTATEANAPA